jgi:hypothetical protein
MDMQQGHAAWTSSMNKQQGNAAKYGHATSIFSMDMQNGHAVAWTYSVDMQHGYASIDIQHGPAAMTSSMDIKVSISITCSMDIKH